MKRKYEDDHGNENGVDSSSDLTTDEDLNGGNDHDSNRSTAAAPLPSQEVSLFFKPDRQNCHFDYFNNSIIPQSIHPFTKILPIITTSNNHSEPIFFALN